MPAPFLLPALVLAACLLLADIGALAAAERFIVLQSTTSTQNSGLLDAILPRFEATHGIAVRVVAVGTGQALKNARNGDADVLLTHAPEAEKRFVAEGHGVAREIVMYNDFVLIGPATDPAGLHRAGDVGTALRAIAAGGRPFVSRGDDSGTHRRERALWRRAGIATDARNPWYREAGAGMGATLNIAAGLGAYTLSDRGTWLAFANRKDLVVLFSGDPLLFNQYAAIRVDPKRHPHVRAEESRLFVDWLTGPDGQAAIAAYRLAGEHLFHPNAAPR